MPAVKIGDPRTIWLAHARRIAIRAQALDGSAKSILDVVRRSGALQLDPTAHVAPNHVLAVWSRLGRHDEPALRRLVAQRKLHEYDAFIVPAEDLPLRMAERRLILTPDKAWGRMIRRFLELNSGFVRYILRELEARGPLPSDALEDRAKVPWPPPPAKPSRGWNSERNRTMALECLQSLGRVMVSGRKGPKRLWDLAERVAPDLERIDPKHVPRLVAERRLHHAGIVRASALRIWYHKVPDLTGIGERVKVEGVRGDWLVRRDLLKDADIPRNLTLLSPFDRLIHDRVRAKDLFGFEFTMEIYVPKGLRKWGYFAMPVLDTDRVVAITDPEFDRAAGVLRVNAIHPLGKIRRAPLREALKSLAETVGAARVVAPAR